MSRTVIHIERLVLDGLPVGARDAGVLRAALEGELVRVFSGDETANAGESHFAAGSRERPSSIAPGTPAGLGREAAQAIHRSVVR
jgi:hypothetical protein